MLTVNQAIRIARNACEEKLDYLGDRVELNGFSAMSRDKKEVYYYLEVEDIEDIDPCYVSCYVNRKTGDIRWENIQLR